MKNSLNNTTRFLRTAAFLMMTLLLSTASLSATEGTSTNPGDSAKAEKVTSKEEKLMIEDLLKSLEDMNELDVIESNEVSKVEVYNSNDELLLTVTEAEWNAQKAKEIVTMNRTAEFLFEMDGTRIYKVF